MFFKDGLVLNGDLLLFGELLGWRGRPQSLSKYPISRDNGPVIIVDGTRSNTTYLNIRYDVYKILRVSPRIFQK